MSSEPDTNTVAVALLANCAQPKHTVVLPDVAVVKVPTTRNDTFLKFAAKTAPCVVVNSSVLPFTTASVALELVLYVESHGANVVPVPLTDTAESHFQPAAAAPLWNCTTAS